MRIMDHACSQQPARGSRLAGTFDQPACCVDVYHKLITAASQQADLLDHRDPPHAARRRSAGSPPHMCMRVRVGV
jgi:hypothetical protein